MATIFPRPPDLITDPGEGDLISILPADSPDKSSGEVDRGWYITYQNLANALAIDAGEVNPEALANDPAFTDRYVGLGVADRVDGEAPVWDADADEWVSAAVGGGGGTTVAVARYDSGWPTRPDADLVLWVADGDAAATTPGAATGDDVVALSPPVVQSSDATNIVEITAAAYSALSPPNATTMYLVIG